MRPTSTSRPLRIRARARLIETIHRLAPEHATLMEVCGTHTVAIARNGIRDLMPEGLRLASGSGCPVCVTCNRDIDTVIALARIPNVTITTFGDMTRGFSGRAFLRERKKVASAPLNPIGSIRFVKPDHANCAIGDNDREMGIWLAAPFWGFGIAPEVAGAMLRYGFDERGLSAIWVCNFVENATSARAKDKLGFELVRLEEATNPVTGVVRTQQVSVLTKSSWENMQKTTE